MDRIDPADPSPRADAALLGALGALLGACRGTPARAAVARRVFDDAAGCRGVLSAVPGALRASSRGQVLRALAALWEALPEDAGAGPGGAPAGAAALAAAALSAVTAASGARPAPGEQEAAAALACALARRGALGCPADGGGVLPRFGAVEVARALLHPSPGPRAAPALAQLALGCDADAARALVQELDAAEHLADALLAAAGAGAGADAAACLSALRRLLALQPGPARERLGRGALALAEALRAAWEAGDAEAAAGTAELLLECDLSGAPASVTRRLVSHARHAFPVPVPGGAPGGRAVSLAPGAVGLAAALTRLVAGALGGAGGLGPAGFLPPAAGWGGGDGGGGGGAGELCEAVAAMAAAPGGVDAAALRDGRLLSAAAGLVSAAAAAALSAATSPAAPRGTRAGAALRGPGALALAAAGAAAPATVGLVCRRWRAAPGDASALRDAACLAEALLAASGVAPCLGRAGVPDAAAGLEAALEAFRGAMLGGGWLEAYFDAVGAAPAATAAAEGLALCWRATCLLGLSAALSPEAGAGDQAGEAMRVAADGAMRGLGPGHCGWRDVVGALAGADGDAAGRAAPALAAASVLAAVAAARPSCLDGADCDAVLAGLPAALLPAPPAPPGPAPSRESGAGAEGPARVVAFCRAVVAVSRARPGALEGCRGPLRAWYRGDPSSGAPLGAAARAAPAAVAAAAVRLAPPLLEMVLRSAGPPLAPLLGALGAEVRAVSLSTGRPAAALVADLGLPGLLAAASPPPRWAAPVLRALGGAPGGGDALLVEPVLARGVPRGVEAALSGAGGLPEPWAQILGMYVERRTRLPDAGGGEATRALLSLDPAGLEGLARSPGPPAGAGREPALLAVAAALLAGAPGDGAPDRAAPPALVSAALRGGAAALGACPAGGAPPAAALLASAVIAGAAAPAAGGGAECWGAVAALADAPPGLLGDARPLALVAALACRSAFPSACPPAVAAWLAAGLGGAVAEHLLSEDPAMDAVSAGALWLLGRGDGGGGPGGAGLEAVRGWLPAACEEVFPLVHPAEAALVAAGPAGLPGDGAPTPVGRWLTMAAAVLRGRAGAPPPGHPGAGAVLGRAPVRAGPSEGPLRCLALCGAARFAAGCLAAA